MMVKEWTALGEHDRHYKVIMKRRYFRSMTLNIDEIFDLHYNSISVDIEKNLFVNLQELETLIILFQTSIYYVVAIIYFAAGYVIILEVQPKLRAFYESIYVLPYNLMETNFNMIREIRVIKSGKLNLF